MKNKDFIKTAFLLVFINYGFLASAQQFAAALVDLQKVQKSYGDNGYMSFKINYSYSKMSAPAVSIDTVSANYKYRAGKFYCSIGPIEFVQNDTMNVAIYKNNRMFFLGNAYKNLTDYGNMFIDGWDSTFVAENIDSISLTTSGVTKKMQIFFDSTSEYTNCTLEYNKTNYRPQKFAYIKRGSVYYPDTTGRKDGIIVTLQFSGYTTSAFNESVFDISKYVIKRNGKWEALPPYNTYKFIDRYFSIN